MDWIVCRINKPYTLGSNYAYVFSDGYRSVNCLIVHMISRAEIHQVPSSTALQVSSIINQFLLAACMIVLLVQILLGTQVREAIDRVATEIYPCRVDFCNVGSSLLFTGHFPGLYLILNALFVVKLWKTAR
jgi:hypothetical protein